MNNLVASVSRLALQGGVLAGAGSLALGIAVNPAVTLLLAAGAVAAYHRQRKRTTTNFGSARFATAEDILAAGLLGQPYGVPLGFAEGAVKPGFRHALQCLFDPSLDADLATGIFLSVGARRSLISDLPLRLPDACCHCAIFSAPSRGKTTGFIIPALLSDPSAPAFVLDIKGEIVKAVGPWRAKHFGYGAIIIDPYGTLGIETHNYNPFDDIDPASHSAIDSLKELSSALVFRTGREVDMHWPEMAEVTLLAFSAFALTYGQPENRNLLAVQELIADAEARAAAIQIMKQSDALGGALRRLGGQLAELKDRESASVISSTLRQISFLHSHPVAHCLSRSNCDLGDFIQGKSDIYLILPPDKIMAQASFLRLILASVIRRIFQEGTSNSRRYRLFLDEAASLGHMTCIDQALAVGRGYGIRLALVYQSMGQLLRSRNKIT